MKSAIWGAGNIADIHMQALRSAGVSVCAVVDKDLQRAESFSKKWDIDNFSDSSDILFNSDISVVHVCTPPALHYDMVKQLLLADKHVFCEKPLCPENDQAKELVTIAAERKLICSVNFNVRFHAACKTAKQIVDSEDFGEVLLIHGNYLQEFAAMPAMHDWRYNTNLAGRMHAVTEIGSHWLDIAQHISGKKIVAVSAMFDKFFPTRYLEGNIMHSQDAPGRKPIEKDREQAAIVNLRFEDSAIGVVTLCEMSHGRYNHIALEVTGEHQSLWWNSEHNNLLHFAKSGGTVNSNTFAFGGGFADTFRESVSAFYEDVKCGVKPEVPAYATFEEGLRITMLCNAIYDSAHENGAWKEVNV